MVHAVSVSSSNIISLTSIKTSILCLNVLEVIFKLKSFPGILLYYQTTRTRRLDFDLEYYWKNGFVNYYFYADIVDAQIKNCIG